jgi:tRNA dimethylallyltransferase
MLHAVELCLQTGRPYSDLLGKRQTLRSFEIVKIGLDLPREELYERINNRVDKMMSQGLLEEAKRLYPQRHLNALNTVGYKELFRDFDGEWSLDFAVQMIKQNSRRYAKRQLTWFRRDDSIRWFSPFEIPEIIEYIKQTIKK